MKILENKFVPATPENMPSERVQRADLKRLNAEPSGLPMPPLPVQTTVLEKRAKLEAKGHRPIRNIVFKEPTIAEMAGNFTAAVGRWIKAGVPVVAKETFESRLAICRGCMFWDEAARLGLGKCNAPGCGCSKAKHWLSTEKCPQGKW